VTAIGKRARTPARKVRKMRPKRSPPPIEAWEELRPLGSLPSTF
jgi:hypothetical protein